ncbi:MAG: hypothetical protein ACP5GH_03515 [Nitrososphaeria archaeon]|jgi:hypothetical protein
MQSAEEFLRSECDGCFAEIFGDARSGKEVIATSLAVERASSGEVVLYVDSRRAFRPELLIERYGVRVDVMGRIDVLSASDPYFLFEKLSRMLSVKRYRTVVWDGMSLPFFELQVAHELSMISRMLSLYSLKGNTVLVTNPIVSMKGKPLGYMYTDPYVHLRIRAERISEDSGRLYAAGWSARFYIRGINVFIEKETTGAPQEGAP